MWSDPEGKFDQKTINLIDLLKFKLRNSGFWS
jgi:hypothetical protein